MIHDVRGANSSNNTHFNAPVNPPINPSGGDSTSSPKDVTHTNKISTDPNTTHRVSKGPAPSGTKVSSNTFKEKVPPAEIYSKTEVYESLLNTVQVLSSTLMLLLNESENTQENSNERNNIKSQIVGLKTTLQEIIDDIVLEQNKLGSGDEKLINDLTSLFRDVDKLDRMCDEYLATGTTQLVKADVGKTQQTENLHAPSPLNGRTTEAARSVFGSDTTPSVAAADLQPQNVQMIGNKEAEISEIVSDLKTNMDKEDFSEVKKEGAKLRERKELLLSARDSIVALFSEGDEVSKTRIKTELENIGKQFLECEKAYEELFAQSLTKENNEIKEVFGQLQNLLGAKFPLPANLKLTLLTFLKTEGGGHAFKKWLEDGNKENQLTGNKLKKNEVPTKIDHYMNLNDMFMNSASTMMQLSTDGSQQINDLLKLAKIIGAKIGLEQNAQAYTDAIMFAVKTPEEILSKDAQSTARRYAMGLEHNRSIPQIISPRAERAFLENDSFKKLETGMLGQVNWKKTGDNRYTMTFTLRVPGENATSVTPQSFSSVLDLGKVKGLDPETVFTFVEQFFDQKSKTLFDSALDKKDLKLLSNVAYKDKLVSGHGFWDWVEAGRKPANKSFEKIEKQFWVTFKNLVELARTFETDSMVKYITCNMKLGM